MVHPPTVIVASLFVSIGGADCPVARAQSAAAVTPAQEAAIEAGIKELSMQWSTAILKKDAAILEKIWTPDFVSVEPTGERVTKADGINALKAGTKQPTVSEATSATIFLNEASPLRLASAVLSTISDDW